VAGAVRRFAHFHWLHAQLRYGTAEDVQHGGHDFGADPVTMGDRDGARARHGGRSGKMVV
jgi:hypothetical protein